MNDLVPMLFSPVYKDYPWGGRWIPEAYQRAAPDGRIAESWEVSAHEDGMSLVDGGPFAGRSLESLVIQYGMELVGSRWQGGAFPLLIKLIDAEQTLSVQVHPDNDRAAAHGGEAKTEMWYVLDAAPEACVYCGFKPGVGRAEVETAVREGGLDGLLNQLPVEAGSIIFVPGGRVHAIGAGCRILEVQQNSNTTYRLYDWDRVGADGRPRELHLEQAARIIDYHDAAPVPSPGPMQQGPGLASRLLMRSDYFLVEELHATGPFSGLGQQFGDSFIALFARHGGLRVEGDFDPVEVPEGRTVMLPAILGDYTVVPDGARCEVLSIRLPPME